MTMIEGWLLDVHENETNTGMVAWIVDDFGTAQGASFLGNPRFMFMPRIAPLIAWNIG